MPVVRRVHHVQPIASVATLPPQTTSTAGAPLAYGLPGVRRHAPADDTMPAMNRAGRYALNSLSVLSLLLALSTATLWVRSYSTFDWVSVASVHPWHAPFMERDVRQLVSARGCLSVGAARMAGPVGTDEGWRWTRAPAPPQRASPASMWGRLGFGFGRGVSAEPSVARVESAQSPGSALVWHNWTVAVPHGLLVALFAILPVRRSLVIARRRRASTGTEGDEKARGPA